VPVSKTVPSLAVASLAKGGMAVFGTRILAMGLALLAEMALTHGLGKAEYGILTAGLSWIAVFGAIAGIGLPSLVVRFFPPNLAQGQLHEAHGVLLWTGRRMLGLALLAGAILAFGSWFILRIWNSAEFETNRSLLAVLLVAGLILPVQNFNLHRIAVLKALKRPILALAPTQIIRPLIIIATIGIFAQFIEQPGAVYGAWGVLFGATAALAIGNFTMRQALPCEVLAATPKFHPRTWWGVALPLGWTGFATQFIGTADPAFLGWLSGPDQSAIYGVAFRIAALLAFAQAAVNLMVAPMISELHATGKTQELQKVLTWAARGILAYVLPTAAVLLIAAPWYLPMFGAGFDDASGPLLWLVVSQVLNALTGSVDLLLGMTGHHHYAARTLGLAALFKVLLNLMLIPLYGAVGAAIGSVIITIFWNVRLYHAVRTRLHLEPSILSSFKRFLPTGRSD
jgi:O-antigen/teichoic acid export membrane protein